MARTESRSARIRVVLLERYVCGALPSGAQTTIAAEFGVTRALVGQVAARIGMTSPKGRARVHQRRTCAKCDTEIGHTNTTGFCLNCRYVDLPCARCGATVRRSAAALAHQFSEKVIAQRIAGGWPLPQGNVFCNRTCMGQYLAAKYGWGSGHGKNHARKPVAS